MFKLFAFAEGGGSGGGGGKRGITMRPASEKRNGPMTQGQYTGHYGSLFGPVSGGTAGPRPLRIRQG